MSSQIPNRLKEEFANEGGQLAALTRRKIPERATVTLHYGISLVHLLRWVDFPAVATEPPRPVASSFASLFCFGVLRVLTTEPICQDS
jgi:hypothetical protein